jgi:hypothetical protein
VARVVGRLKSETSVQIPEEHFSLTGSMSLGQVGGDDSGLVTGG